MHMKSVLKILFLLIFILFTANVVISDRLLLEFNPSNNDLNVHYAFPANSDSVDTIIIDLKLTALLLCIGLIGIIAVDRKRFRSNNDVEDVSPRQ